MNIRKPPLTAFAVHASIWPSRNRGPALPTALCGMTPVYCACVQQRSSINRLRIQNFAKPLQRSQDHSLLPGGQRDKAIPELHLQQVGRCFQNILSCRSGAHENLTLVPLSSLARDEGKPFQTIKDVGHRSEEHTSELQSLMRISYAVFCLKKKKNHTTHQKQLI